MSLKSYQYMLVFILMGANAQAASTTTANYNFSGTLIEPALCTINNNNDIDVVFGDDGNVAINKIDGVNYAQDISFTVQCNSGSTTSGMKMTLTGAAMTSDVDGASIQTTKTDLGIKIYYNNTQPFMLGRPVSVDPNALPTLRAVPVKAPAGTLTSGSFSAIATLSVYYE